jgi:uncharacterized protein (TIGR02597 family)
MRRHIICSLAIALAIPTLTNAQTVATDPVGFLALNVASPAATGGSAISLLGLAFTNPVAYQATLSSASGTTLTDSNANFTSGTYNGAANNYYIELITGTGTGVFSQITSASGTSIVTAKDLSSYVTSGTGYKIRKNWTLASVFGTDPASNLVLTGGTATSADEVLVYSTTAHAYTIYYYKSSGLGGTGWRTSTDPSTDVSNTAYFSPVDGLIVRRHTAGTLPNTSPASNTFPLAGAVKLGQTDVPIATGLNLISNVYPSGTLTLGASGTGIYNSNLLGSGNGVDGVAPGTATTADLVLIYNPSTSQYVSYYYKSGGLGGTGWRTTTDPSTDQSATVIPTGQSIIIQRNQNRAGFTWVCPQPFTIQ